MKTLILTCICLIFVTVGCSKVQYVYVPTPIYPPLEYLEKVQEPQLRGRTNNDLAKYIFALRTAIAEGNQHKVKMLEWIQSTEERFKSEQYKDKSLSAQ
jgi:hypothetical protein